MKKQTIRVAIVGTGLIGGSLGLGLRGLPEIESVVGYDSRPGRGEAAVEAGALDRAAGSIEDAVSGADVVLADAVFRRQGRPARPIERHRPTS